MKILVTGGAGYIGSHVVKALGLTGQHDITIVDNLSSGHREAVTAGRLVVADLGDESKLQEIFQNGGFEAVFHFAGSISVRESVTHPLKYYKNNTANSLNLLSMCQRFAVKYFVFSSTAAVYGIPRDGICTETSELAPINPYGRSKQMTESMLQDLATSSDLKFVCLRYFNVAGADGEGQIGQSFPEPFHLINLACEAALGKRSELNIFGTGYPTKDGTCVRDYIHVSDLAEAHVQALNYLIAGGPSEILNCGYGRGYSVREVISKVKKVTGTDFKVVESDPREGDPAILIARAERIRSVLGWIPKFDDLEVIIKTAYNWERKRRY